MTKKRDRRYKPRTWLGLRISTAAKRKPLTRRQRECASQFIAEELATGKYGRSQAVAIGLSRARRECK